MVIIWKVIATSERHFPFVVFLAISIMTQEQIGSINALKPVYSISQRLRSLPDADADDREDCQTT
jgi:hypothetical protein